MVCKFYLKKAVPKKERTNEFNSTKWNVAEVIAHGGDSRVGQGWLERCGERMVLNLGA